ncbi:ribosome biogenesis GTPase YlqF [Alteribacillus iranensis]|uniref:Ribosome biogenesis GTPase A n=1 Tax=Alteribacillus iranensis TaxID=930128 RepID=A0A1I2A5U6_9BACI|nr:ribosome biogenesis GTPase YlqF [Alteribacillus iranensis]SFE39435.1 Ras superfamily GTP-binding protein YlqF [Alteribacillus iranensis]
MTIQWYPGHMAKAKREVAEQLKRVDMVIELADARVPQSSRNPMLDSIIQDKPRLLVLTKSDMADAAATEEWMKVFAEQGTEVISINALKNQGAKPIIEKAKKLTAPFFEKRKKKGIRPRAIRAMVIGIPNVGKSTVINRLVGKNTARTGNKPGITQKQQWLKVSNTMELLDTPGILWPKFDDPLVGYRLAVTGAIKDDLLDFGDIALFTLRMLKERYRPMLLERYQLRMPLPEEDLTLFEEIGKHRGCLKPGGVIDYEKAAEIIIRDIRSLKLGRITLEVPEDWNDK